MKKEEVPMNNNFENKVWMKYYSEEAKKVEMPKCTAYDFMMQQNNDRMDTPALHYYGKDITFNELAKRVDDTAKAFAAVGVKAGDIVSFVSVQIPETIAAVYALNKLGAAANTIDPRMDVASIERMIKSSGSRILVTIDIAFPKIAKIIDSIKQDLIITQSAGTSLPLVMKILLNLKVKNDITYSDTIIKWTKFIENGKNAEYTIAPYVGDATVAITYTGGTSGIPKGVVLTNDSMNAVAINFLYCDVVREEKDRFLGIIPIFSAYGMVCGMHMPLCMRVTLVPIPRFIPTQIGKLVKKYRPNHVISTPVFIELLMQSKEVKGMDLSFLRTLASGGDTMNEGLEAKLNEFRKAHNMNYPLAQGYGMSELSAAACFCVNRIYKPRSVGIPSLTTEVKIVDPDTGKELNFYERGEVCVTGPSMMKCYFNAPEETADVMRVHEDGRTWIHSGDIGYMDEDGFVFIEGRIKRMITRFDGHKVFPINLEGLINALTGVRNCSVVGVNDMDHSQGQYPIAIVEFAEGVINAEVECQEIFKLCDENVEERGKPVAVIAVDSIPLTPFGKNDYRTLEAQYKTYDYKAWAAGN
ncbi:MAG: acyl--CoA ligase [Ruminococcaceae bacterium]|nr:acyl--CoA ligase [Oscillospiraceae bacterium]